MTDDAHAAMAVALEAGLGYTGLRGFEPDPKLFHYLPPTLASRERAVPVILVGDRLKVASSRPDPDLTLVRQRFPYLTVDIVIAPAVEIERALQRASGTS
ncbi:GspE/PulE/PilB domain-containing protein [Capillimicrobium parvum]|uniref:Type II secretion system protein GspE N-terminal domain-containing protein n=1 Tax=Capillimicrobium parvum TaxID=2884022 RepID=A0A9E7C6K4_9ACTN|nr:hypothetical protein [Capillimicrobium parvum]UGS38892.1 hypothetical protein DSM104329_05323 [Capillimicrobium parvum]